MNKIDKAVLAGGHGHVFLGEAHEASERRTWYVIVLCGAMMVAEIVGGILFGSIALVADGLHMSTHAGALLLAALAYTYSRKHAKDPRYTFGTGKFGDLAGFTSAIVLAMIALLIGYEAVGRLFAPVPIDFAQAIPIAILGLLVNVGSVFLLSGDHHHGHSHGHDHGHGHSHGHGHDDHDEHDDGHHHHDDEQRVLTAAGPLVLSVFEDGVPPVFRIRAGDASALPSEPVAVETIRPDGARQTFPMVLRDGYLESVATIPEPHAFKAVVSLAGRDGATVTFEDHAHGDHAHDHHAEAHDGVDVAAHRDNNMRAAIVHVMADAAVSVLLIVGLLLARAFGWLWMDPLAGIVGALVIASWAYGLMRDTGAILLDVTPDRKLPERVVVAKFDGGRLSSDGGLLLLREAEQRLKVSDRLAACVKDPRDPELITHSLADIIRFRLLMIAAGYEDGNDASALRSDPMFKMALDLAPSDRELCSQSTISRLENLPDPRALLRMGRSMVDL